MAKHSLGDLQQMQSLPLKDKIKMTQRRIEEWYEHYDGNVYVSFSGGKDSTVLLHLVREMYPDVPAVFVDTGLEYPEIRKFVMQHDNVTIIKPKMNLVQVIKKYGYPMFSKEVSECVYGARKYLTSLIESGSLDRPTDRPTEPEVCLVHGRHVECSSQIKRRKRESGLSESNDGDCPLCGLLNGILTAQNTIDARLWNHYKQFQGATNDEHSPDQGNGNDGEYP